MCFDGFFVFKQKTAYEVRISDWSSDVCSSDLRATAPLSRRRGRPRRADRGLAGRSWRSSSASGGRPGRADRKSVVSGKSVSVRVDLGGRRIIKKKNKQ